MRNRVALIIPYFGHFPSYFDYFLQTCSFNPAFQFLIFSDNERIQSQPYENISFIPFTLAQFNLLASEQLGVPVQLKTGYKLCDLKPMYGHIFEAYLKGYDFWGYCDTDIIFGDLSKIITDELLNAHDVISTNPLYMAGPFSLYRNSKDVNTGYTGSKDFKRVLQEDKVFLFDEASDVIRKLWEGHNIYEFPSEVESITHVLRKETVSFRTLFAPFISERILHGSKLIWENGVLKHSNGVEVHIFHFIVYKSKITFNTPPFTGTNRFFFTQHGIFLPSLRAYTTDWFRSICRITFSKIKKRLKF